MYVVHIFGNVVAYENFVKVAKMKLLYLLYSGGKTDSGKPPFFQREFCKKKTVSIEKPVA